MTHHTIPTVGTPIYPPEQRTSVLIVGAGPAGLTLANLLGLYGTAAIVVERNAALSDVPKALMIDDEYFRLLDTLGLADDIKQHCAFPVGMKYYAMFGFPIATIDGHVTANRFAARSATWQPALEQALLQNLLRFPSVSVRFEQTLSTIEECADGVRARVVDANGVNTEIVAQFLVGADGARSTVRKLLNIEFEGTTLSAQRHVVVDVADDPDGDLVGKLILNPALPSTSLPLAYHGRRYEFKIKPDVDAEQVLANASVRRLISRFRNVDDLKIIRKTVYTFHGRIAKRFRKGSAFLIGDAAHAMPPFGAQGMNSGARDANNLAWKLAAVADGHANSALLNTYDQERRDQVAGTIAVSVRQGRLVNTASYAGALLRDLVFVALSIAPSIKRYIAQMKYIPKPFLRAGLVLGVPTRDERTVLGHILPQPDVRNLDGTPQLLDKLVGPNFAVLAIEPDTTKPISGVDHPLWRTLGTQFLSLHWSVSPPPAIVGFRPLRVVSPHFDHVLERHRGRFLIVRPDRLVAAIVGAADLEDAANTLARLIGAPQREDIPPSNVSRARHCVAVATT
jgi:3-(3-hydroxy-phenyl)propionate hydroxylase